MGGKITVVVAMDRCRAIGRDGGMPWHLPADLRHFKEVTLGHPVIMGRRTWESIGRPLPGRRNIVVSRSMHETEGIEVAATLEAAFDLCGDEHVMIIGGGEIYRQAMDRADRLLVTEVDTEVEGADTWFPSIDTSRWKERTRRSRPRDEHNAHDLDLVEYVRRPMEVRHG